MNDNKYSIPGWVNTVFLIILGVIGWLYVEGQTNLKDDIKQLKESDNNSKARIIKLETDFGYTKKSIEEIKEDVKAVDKKLDRLLEK